MEENHKPLRKNFPRSSRLTRSADFRRLFRRGRRLNRGQLTLVWLTNNVEEQRFTPVASRKVGNAVRRNRLRRRLKELYRLHRHHLPAKLHFVFITRRGAAELCWNELRETVFELWQEAGLIAEHPTT